MRNGEQVFRAFVYFLHAARQLDLVDWVCEVLIILEKAQGLVR